MNLCTVQLGDMAHGGDAVGRHQGQVVFVPGGIPGERVRVEIEATERRFTRGRIVEILQPSPTRVTAPCAYFDRCGGCQWQHIDYAAQLVHKEEILRSQLERIGKLPQAPVRPVLGMEEPWAYRNHVQLKVDAQSRVGYYAAKSHDVVPVDTCLIAHPLVDDLWNALDIQHSGVHEIALRAGAATGEQMVILRGRESDPLELEVDIPVSCVYQSRPDELLIMAGAGHYHERLHGRSFQVSAPSFFQVNTAQAERMVRVVRDLVDIRSDEHLLDAYCGVGTFALLLASRAGRVTGIESDPWALADADVNCTEENVRLLDDDVGRALSRMNMRVDAVIVDPPRGGCGTEVIEALARLRPGRIVHVACDPATLARDARLLAARGYELVLVQAIDMFPQTYHIEAVALFRRASS